MFDFIKIIESLTLKLDFSDGVVILPACGRMKYFYHQLGDKGSTPLFTSIPLLFSVPYVEPFVDRSQCLAAQG